MFYINSFLLFRSSFIFFIVHVNHLKYIINDETSSCQVILTEKSHHNNMKDKIDIRQVFYERLKELMLEKGLNNSQLAEKTGIPRTTINGWTLKQNKPQADVLCVLADFFKVSVDYLLGRED